VEDQAEVRRWVIRLAYDGSRYSGWQTQRSGTAVQDVVQRAMAIPLRSDIALIGASRTDSGVHAACQVAHFDSGASFEPLLLLHSLNSLLPDDIRCMGIAPAPEGFHAQISAIKKSYRYRIQLGPVADPLRRHYCWHIKQALDYALLCQALKCFEGTHDFTAFANRGSTALGRRGAWRTIFDISIERALDEIVIHCSGDGFLYKMVRNMVGAALAVSQHKLSLDSLLALLKQGERSSLPAPAAAHGLCLMKLTYQQELLWQPS